MRVIPIICQWIPGHRPLSLKRTKNKISEYGLYITKTDYYKVSCGVVVGSVLKAWWTGVGFVQARCVSCRQSGGGQLGGGGGSLKGA